MAILKSAVTLKLDVALLAAYATLAQHSDKTVEQLLEYTLENCIEQVAQTQFVTKEQFVQLCYIANGNNIQTKLM